MTQVSFLKRRGEYFATKCLDPHSDQWITLVHCTCGLVHYVQSCYIIYKIVSVLRDAYLFHVSTIMGKCMVRVLSLIEVNA